jgi:hypothetical protein
MSEKLSKKGFAGRKPHCGSGTKNADIYPSPGTTNNYLGIARRERFAGMFLLYFLG